jgi:hypothetical protein
MDEGPAADPGRGAIWMRALYMVLFAIIYSVTEIVVVLVAVFQFFCVLITGQRNSQVLALGQSLSTYVYEILLFETFNSERLPFPFAAWPRAAEHGP